jgi:hypothetical protein
LVDFTKLFRQVKKAGAQVLEKFTLQFNQHSAQNGAAKFSKFMT